MAARNPENVVNFAPGPAKIPAEVGVEKYGRMLKLTFTFQVRKRVQDGIHSINGTGVGILGKRSGCHGKHVYNKSCWESWRAIRRATTCKAA